MGHVHLHIMMPRDVLSNFRFVPHLKRPFHEMFIQVPDGSVIHTLHPGRTRLHPMDGLTMWSATP